MDLEAMMKGRKPKSAPMAKEEDSYNEEPEDDGEDLDGPALIERFDSERKAGDFTAAWATLKEAVSLAQFELDEPSEEES